MKIFSCLALVLFSISILQAQNAVKTLEYDGVNDYVQTTYGGITGSNARTVEAWIKTDYKSSQEVICNWGAMTPNGSRFTFNMIAGKLRIEIGGQGLTSNTTVSDDKWHHVAVSYNPSASTKYTLFVDGELDSTFNISQTINTTSTVNLRIGTRSDLIKNMNGNIDEFRIWDTALSVASINAWCHRAVNTTHPSYSNLVAYYNFDEGTGTSTNDSSTNSYTGTLTNFGSNPWTSSYAPIISQPTDFIYNIASSWPAKSTSSSSIMSIADIMSGNTYVIYAHNHNPLNYNLSNKPATILKRLSRIWRLEKEGSLIGDIVFDYSSLDTSGFYTFKLLKSSDTSFANASILGGIKIGGQKIKFSNDTFQDSSFYTIGAFDFQPPTVQTYQVADVLAYSATIKGKVLDDGGLTTTRGICWSTSTNPDIFGNKTNNGTGLGIYTATLGNLTHSTTYHVRAYAYNLKDTVYGADSSFTTPSPAPPTVTTNGLLTLYTDSAFVKGTVVHDGNVTVTERGFCWSTSLNPTAALSTKLSKGGGKGTYTGMITNLIPNTQYHFRAYAINSIDTSYGGDSVFITFAISIPTVITGAVSTIKGSTANVAGMCNFDGRRPVTDKGIVWDTVAFPTISLSTKTNEGPNIGSFISNLTGLQSNTTYYARAYATNSVGTAYGADTTFLTATQPTVQIDYIFNISFYSVSVRTNVTSDGRMPVTSRGVCYGTSVNPDLYGTVVIMGSGTGVVTINLTNLTQNTTYHVRAFAINAVDTSYSADSIFTSLKTNPPTVSTKTVSNIMGITSDCGGIVSFDGGTNVFERGICWSTNPNPTANLPAKLIIGSGTGSFNGKMTNLNIGTNYHVRAYAINNVDTSYGGDTTFTTLDVPTVTTDTISNISGLSAHCGGTVTDDGGSSVIRRGVCWNTSTNPTAKLTTKTYDGNGLGHFNSIIGGLSPNTMYYVRAYAISYIDTGYGNEASFMTHSAPVVKTAGISLVTGYTAKVDGNVVSGDNVTTRGIVWSKFPNPMVGLPTKTVEGSGLGTFSSIISGLEPNTTYHVRAYATNGVGTTYGGDSTLLTATTPSLTTSTITINTSTTATSGGNISNDGRMPITSRGVCWSENPAPVATLPTKTDDGTGIGSFSSSITGLQANKTYYIRAYAINGVDTAYGNERSFQITPPVAVTGTATNISIESADLAGTVNAKGQLTSVYFEYGLTSAYGNNTAGTPNNISTDQEEPISAGIISLSSDEEYHYRIVAESNHGISYGADSVFNTLINSIADLKLQDLVIKTENGAIRIRINNPNFETVIVRIFDLMGNEVYSNKVRQEALIQMPWGAACYLLQFISNNEVYTKKVIVE